MDMSREDKLYLGIGIAAAIAVSTIAIVLSGDKQKAPPKKSYGLKVGPQCSTYELTDETKAKETIAQLVSKAVTKGAVDPFNVTREWIRAAAGQCATYPAQTQNPGEAVLFQHIFYEVLIAMREQNLVSESMEGTYTAMVDTWAQSQGADTVIT